MIVLYIVIPTCLIVMLMVLTHLRVLHRHPILDLFIVMVVLVLVTIFINLYNIQHAVLTLCIENNVVMPKHFNSMIKDVKVDMYRKSIKEDK